MISEPVISNVITDSNEPEAGRDRVDHDPSAPGPGASEIPLLRGSGSIVGRRKWVQQMMENVVRYGMKDRLASFKSVDLGVLEFHLQDGRSLLHQHARLLAGRDLAVGSGHDPASVAHQWALRSPHAFSSPCCLPSASL